MPADAEPEHDAAVVVSWLGSASRQDQARRRTGSLRTVVVGDAGAHRWCAGRVDDPLAGSGSAAWWRESSSPPHGGLLAADERATYDGHAGPRGRDPGVPRTAGRPHGGGRSGAGGGARDRDGRLGTAVDAVATVVRDAAALEELTLAGIRDRVEHLERLRGLADAALTASLSALHARGGIRADGAASTTEWLRTHTRRSASDAARLARLSANLPELPGTERALADGDLTAEAADALVGAVRDGRLGSAAQVEADLLEAATEASPERLRADIRRRRQAADADAMLRDEQSQHDRRRVHLSRRRDGMWPIHGELPDEVGQRMRTLLEAHDRPRPGPDGHDPRRPEQRMADALSAAVDTLLDHGLAPATGGVARPHLSVIVPYETIAADLASAGDDAGSDNPDRPVAPDDARWSGLAPGELPWGGALSPQAVRRLLCDAAVSRIVMSGSSQVLDVGRATRSWSEPQRRAVNARDRGCRGPSCHRPIAWTNIHHVRWWDRDHGPTDVDNGLALCHHCHHLVHDRGWQVHLDPSSASATWTSPTGQVTVTTPRTLDDITPTGDGERPPRESRTGPPVGSTGPPQR